MLDWLRKEMINQYCYSNIDEDRTLVKEERINGRLYEKHGVDCASTLVAIKYKVPIQGSKFFKTALLIGLARQNPCDSLIDIESGFEVAKENALTNPCMVIEYNESPSDEAIYFLMKSYVLGLPCRFVKTAQEMKALGKDIKEYNRQMGDNKYYNDYYKDFVNKFWHYRS